MATKRYPEVYNIQGKRIAILQNASSISYELIKNQLWTASFTLPLNDPKLEFVQPKYHIDIYDYDRRIGRFIVNPKQTVKNESTREVTFELEHVWSLLHSDVLFGYHQFTNYPTRTVLEGLLQQQEVKHWKLGKCDFTRYFHYGWENEDSLLNPIRSVAEPFDEPYMWTWDDSSYPYTLNLVEPPTTVKDVIKYAYNMKGIEVYEDPTNLITRIYPLGSGEGINQVNIKKVNNGIPYLQDDEAVEKYGIHKRIWVDTRFEDDVSLKASGKALLDKYKEPLRSFSISARDYTVEEREKKKKAFQTYSVGDIILVHDLDTDIHEEQQVEKYSKSDVYGAPQDLQLELGNLIPDITTTTTDLEKKQLVNETYSQGATNIDSRDFQDNCDDNYPAVIRFPIPNDVVNINEMTLTFETAKYRAYSKAIEGGGATVKSTEGGGGTTKSTSSGGGSTQTSSSGGGVSKSTASGGGTTQTSSAGGDHDHVMFMRLGGTVTGSEEAYLCGGGIVSLLADNPTLRTASSSGDHTHAVNIPAHTHSFETPNHTHNVSIPAHTHDVTLPNHTHEFTLPNHTHAIKHGIYEYETLPTSVQITVDGNVVPHTAISGENIDLIPYLQKGSDGRISRGRYAEIKIKPNGLARINATVSSRLFIQSRIGGNF